MTNDQTFSRARAAALVAVVSLLAACGSKQPPGTAGFGSPGARLPSGNASAAQVAAAARGEVRCPARIDTAAPAAGGPVADIVGVRPGMTWEEAANVVLCTGDLLVVAVDTSRHFNIDTHGQTIRQGFSARFAEPRVQKDSRQIMREMQDDA